MTATSKPESRPNAKQGKARINMNWTQLSAIINGDSAIDQDSLTIRNRSEAKRFALEYGFNPDDPTYLQHILEVHAEAIAFIEEFFLSLEEAKLISPRVRYPEHVLDLLVFSSNYLNKSNIRQMWACAVLKVMHGIFHIDHDFKLRYFDKIRDQIFNAWDKLILLENGKHFLLGQNDVRIPIHFFQKKRNKDRKSVLLKLLQKAHYVAADIYDHLGIRMVFETKAECLFALQLLRRQHLVTVTNIKPFRSRNSLVDIKEAQCIFKKYRSLLGSTEYPLETLKRMDAEMDGSVRTNVDNPHSSDEYRAIQVTVRKMVHLPNPARQRIDELIEIVGDRIDLPQYLIHDPGLDKELIIYFDYEIQLMDRKNWEMTKDGPSSHDAYKMRQQETARKRVLGPSLIRTLEELTQREQDP